MFLSDSQRAVVRVLWRHSCQQKASASPSKFCLLFVKALSGLFTNWCWKQIWRTWETSHSDIPQSQDGPKFPATKNCIKCIHAEKYGGYLLVWIGTILCVVRNVVHPVFAVLSVQNLLETEKKRKKKEKSGSRWKREVAALKTLALPDGGTAVFFFSDPNKLQSFGRWWIHERIHGVDLYLRDGWLGVYIARRCDFLQLVDQLCDGQPLVRVHLQHRRWTTGSGERQDDGLLISKGIIEAVMTEWRQYHDY